MMLEDPLSLLVLYGLLTAAALGLSATGLVAQLGMGYMLSARDDPRSPRGMIARIQRAVTNSLTALALVTPPVLILAIRGGADGGALLAMQVFLVARVVYYPAYALGIVGLRTLAWVVGFVATIALYLLAL